MPRDLHDSRRYTRDHLYSAVHLKLDGIEKLSGKEFSGSGTGFFVHADRVGAGYYLVTARHVLDPGHAKEPGSGLWQLESVTVRGAHTRFRGYDTEFEFSLPYDRAHFHPDPDIDLAVVFLAEEDVPSEVFGVAFRTKDFIRPAAILSDDVGPGTEIVMAGYPRLENGVGYRPLLVPGIVSSDLRYDADYGGHQYPGRGICHSFSRGGMSGAPVLTTVVEGITWEDDGPREPAVQLLGVNTGHPLEKDRPEALSLFVPITALAALVDDDMEDLYQRIAERAADLAGVADISNLNRALLRPRGVGPVAPPESLA